MEHWQTIKWTGDGISVMAVIGTLLGFLPAVAALAAFIWYLIQIYESDTCQKWLEKHRMTRKARRVAKIRAEQKVLLAELEALEVVREARAVAHEKVAKAAKEAAMTRAAHETHEKTAALAADASRGVFKSAPAVYEDGTPL